MIEDLQYDYVVIGSGFGGSVSALRLSEKGYKVLLVEKGKWYGATDFAKTNWDFKKWLWMPLLKCFGIMKMSVFRHVTVVSGVGVGGGSLVYANTLPVPKSDFFNTGNWKDLNNWEKELSPFYQQALKMLGATTNPKLFDSDKALQQVAKQIGKTEQFSETEVGVYFGKADKVAPDPYFDGKGPERKGCNFCGSCMTGCRNNSKNSLDKNYLYLAQQKGAEIRAEKEVVDILPLKGRYGSEGYEIVIKDSTRWLKKKSCIRTRGVILSGGVLGTVKLLLKLKPSSLPRLSEKVGHYVRTNNETLVSVSSLNKELNLSKGVAIGSILHTDQNSHIEIVRYGEGSNAWKPLHLPYAVSKNTLIRITRALGALFRSPGTYFQIYFKNSWAKKTVVLLFMQTLDSTLVLKKNILGRMGSRLGSGKKPSPFIKESVKLTSLFEKQLNGKAMSFAGETIMGVPSTAHILGGAVMGKDIQSGVIDKNNKVFGYKNMYVIDGSMISANPGVNPSLTITAIAERAMSKIEEKSRADATFAD